MMKNVNNVESKNKKITKMMSKMFPNNSGHKRENTFYRDEKMLLESDPHSLEQQRYLARLRNSEIKQKMNYQ